MCLTKSKCSKNFSFMTVGYQNGLDTLYASGIVGMSPSEPNKKNDLFII